MIFFTKNLNLKKIFVGGGRGWGWVEEGEDGRTDEKAQTYLALQLLLIALHSSKLGA